MIHFYRPKYFQLYELMPEDMYKQLINQGWSVPKIWQVFFDVRILLSADRLRSKYGKMSANTWYWGGQHNYRGVRQPDCKIGAKYSQHKYGRALDLVPLETPLETIWADMDQAPMAYQFEFITTCERNVSWLHVDCRNHNKNQHGILLVYP